MTGLHTIVFGDTAVAGATRVQRTRIAKPHAFEPVAVEPDALSTIGYTSGTTGHPEGRHAVASRRHAQRRHDRADAAEDEPRHCRDRAAVSACLRQRRLQRRHAVRPQARAASALRRRRDPGEHSGAQGDDVRGRADDVHVHARASRPRPIRSHVAHPLHGRRADHAGRQDAGSRESASAVR